jgi:HTH-type transcriptional regulator/antitoxin HigA
MNAQVQIEHILPAWKTFRSATDIAPIRDEAHYRRMVAMLESLLAQANGDESHAAMELVDIVGDLIEDFETEHHPLPEVSGVQALKFLMEQHGLKQNDLSEVGSQGVVSEILAGKRELNIRQVRALSERFGVSPATFVQTSSPKLTGHVVKQGRRVSIPA